MDLFSIVNLLTSWAAYIPDWIVAITSVVTAASAIVALTPTKADDDALAKVMVVLNWLALNFGKKK